MVCVRCCSGKWHTSRKKGGLVGFSFKVNREVEILQFVVIMVIVFIKSDSYLRSQRSGAS